MAKMSFSPQQVDIDYKSGQSVLEIALENDLPVNHSCDGNGTCTTCRVIVRSDIDKLPARNSLELETIAERGFRPEERLSCQLLAFDGLEVEIP